MGRTFRKGQCKDCVYEVLETDSEECILWPFGRDGEGYGRASVPGFKSRLAHRIICEIRNGPPPFEKAYARHLCGNGHLGCVNPKHLAWGSAKDNQDDELALGRRRYGEQTHKAVLTEQSVRAIRALRETGLSYQKIGLKFGVARGTIQAIAEKRTWPHVL